MPSVSSAPFRLGGWDENDDKYRCCCRSTHVKVASAAIGWLHLVLMGLAGSVLLYAYASNSDLIGRAFGDADDTTKYLAGGLALACLLQLLMVLMLLLGVQKEKGGLMMPFIVVTGLCTFSNACQVMMDFGRLVHDSSNVNSSEVLTHWLSLLLQLWMFQVLWRTYKFFGDKKLARKIHDHVRIMIPEADFTADDHIYKVNYAGMDEPPPYADTVTSDKVPLTSAA